MHLFGNKPYVFVRKYKTGKVLRIDAPTWRRYNAKQLLNLGNDAFDKTDLLKFCLKALTNISIKYIMHITAAPIAHEKTSNGDVVPISEEIIMLKSITKNRKTRLFRFCRRPRSTCASSKRRRQQAPQAQEAPPEEIKVYIQNAGSLFLKNYLKTKGSWKKVYL